MSDTHALAQTVDGLRREVGSVAAVVNRLATDMDRADPTPGVEGSLSEWAGKFDGPVELLRRVRDDLGDVVRALTPPAAPGDEP